MTSKTVIPAVIALALAASGCAHVDTGQVDYRVVDSASKAATSGCATCVTLRDRYRIAGGAERPFEPGEVYSMEIEQMMVGNNILEGYIPGLGVNTDKSGEFAVLANVFEFASTAEEAAGRRFLRSNEIGRDPADTSDVEMKLIYYGDDIQARQAINFSNIPLHQRSTYNGGSIGIQLAVMEVDAGSGPMAKLLTTLAKFGQKAIPASSEVSDVLFDLGESLLTGSKGDDRMLDYRFVLSRTSDNLDATQALFTPGRYILRRNDSRHKPHVWDTVYFDTATGRLMDKDGELREEMYIVVNIRRYPHGTAPEHYSFERWSTVRAELEKADPMTTPLTKLKETLDAKLTEERSAEWRKILLGRWSLAESSLRSLQSRFEPDIASDVLATCTSEQKKLASRAGDLAELRARDALREFRAQFQNAIRVPAAGGESEFSTTDRQQLVSRVAQYFLPWEGDAQAHFADLASFTSLVNDTSALSTLAVTTAKGRSVPATGCQDLPAV